MLITKHFVADFVVQNRWQAMNKGTYGHPGGIVHASIHFIFTVAVLLAIAIRLNEIPLLFYLALGESILHYHIDWAKMNLVNKLDVNAYSPSPGGEIYWIILGFDQLLHYMCYVVITWLLLHP